MAVKTSLMTRLDNTSYSVRDLTLAMDDTQRSVHFGEIKLQQDQGSFAMLQGTNITCAYAIKSELMHLFSLDFA